MTHTAVLAIANRGEIAVRIARTARQNGWQPVVLLSEAERNSFAARAIGNVEPLGAGDEFSPSAVVEAARHAGARALHPGYGFLSERAELSRLCLEAGIIFVGPSPETLEICGDKLATRRIAEESGLPLVPASQALTIDNSGQWQHAGDQVGYPLIVKATGAGGGRGLRIAPAPEELEPAIRSALNETGGSGAEATVFLEYFLEGARHVEVQVAGDGADAVALGDRDCSLQRRHQKVIEEAPVPNLQDDIRLYLHANAATIARAVGLSGLATIEFLLAGNRLAFMEINPRLQVEHTVTEAVTGLDLVGIQLELATGGSLPEPAERQGHAIQARLYAEDPFNRFLPSPGELRVLDFPNHFGLRVDSGYEAGDVVPGEYDPLIAKMIASGNDRGKAIDNLRGALVNLRVAGIATNRPWLLNLLDSEDFRANSHDLSTAGRIEGQRHAPSPELLATTADIMLESRESGESAWISAGAFRIVSPATLVLHGDEAGGWQRSVPYPTSPEKQRGSGRDQNPRGTVAIRAGEFFEVSAPDGRWIVKPGPRPSDAKHQAGLDGVLRAPMPGKVLAVNVQAGQTARDGDVLAVLEAMKIEISLSAPFTGRVTAVHAGVGDLIGTQQPVVTLAPVDDGQHQDQDGSEKQ